MRAHYLQHVPFEGLGSIEPWLENRGYDISYTRFFDAGVLPEVKDIDLLVVMGGPMSVNDERAQPWLVRETAFIRRVIEEDKAVLGICLGAQLIAKAMGGAVFPNPVKEIGWFPIEAVNADDPKVFRFPEKVHVFHWHGETFHLPNGALRIAKSEGCANQAFAIGHKVIGLQFHLETTPLSARALVENCRGELVDGQYIQSQGQILSAPRDRYATANRLMDEVLEHLQGKKQAP
ncbi:MAG: type 1 glutamine amidotransferase [Opitutales bacterium]|nr:type 1 glutamine amidotransferase [Opitutales bacterium]